MRKRDLLALRCPNYTIRHTQNYIYEAIVQGIGDITLVARVFFRSDARIRDRNIKSWHTVFGNK